MTDACAGFDRMVAEVCLGKVGAVANQVKGFVVGKDNPGFSVEKIKTKMALRVVQNGLITLKDCHVPEADRLRMPTPSRTQPRS
jgi:alkylation response protein AidB-like acyl-CoA dehydrogenase